MNPKFKPLLADDVDFAKLNFSLGLLGSPKLDGIRAIGGDGILISRSLKPIPNLFVQELFRLAKDLDGELIAGDPTSPTVYIDTYRAVMKKDGEPDVTFYVFDHVGSPTAPYIDRRNLAAEALRRMGKLAKVVLLEQIPLSSLEAVNNYEAEKLALGYEGIMLRAQGHQYKFGRATATSNTLLKVKRFTDSEATIVGFEEEMENRNAATVNALGHTERSSHAENKFGKGRLGALICELPSGARFNIGTGFSHAVRQEIWDQRDKALGKQVVFKHFLVGAIDLPRFPTFKGFRSPLDL